MCLLIYMSLLCWKIYYCTNLLKTWLNEDFNAFYVYIDNIMYSYKYRVVDKQLAVLMFYEYHVLTNRYVFITLEDILILRHHAHEYKLMFYSYHPIIVQLNILIYFIFITKYRILKSIG